MERFYFHLENRIGRVLDEEGVEMPGLQEAVSYAIENVRSILSDEVKRGVADFRGNIAIADARGAVVRVIEFKDAVELRLASSAGDRAGEFAP